MYTGVHHCRGNNSVPDVTDPLGCIGGSPSLAEPASLRVRSGCFCVLVWSAGFDRFRGRAGSSAVFDLVLLVSPLISRWS